MAQNMVNDITGVNNRHIENNKLLNIRNRKVKAESKKVQELEVKKGRYQI